MRDDSLMNIAGGTLLYNALILALKSEDVIIPEEDTFPIVDTCIRLYTLIYKHYSNQ